MGPKLVYVALAEDMRAIEDGHVSVTLTYDRPLQRTGSDPLSLTLLSSDFIIHPYYICPFVEESQLNVAADPNWTLWGVRAVVQFTLTPVDLRGLEGLVMTCSNYSPRVGWDQLSDLDTGEPIPFLFDPPYLTVGFVRPVV